MGREERWHPISILAVCDGGREGWGEEIINWFFRIGCFSGSVGRSVGVGIIGKVRKGLSLKKGVGRREGNPNLCSFRHSDPQLLFYKTSFYFASEIFKSGSRKGGEEENVKVGFLAFVVPF